MRGKDWKVVGVMWKWKMERQEGETKRGNCIMGKEGVKEVWLRSWGKAKGKQEEI